MSDQSPDVASSTAAQSPALKSNDTSAASRVKADPKPAESTTPSATEAKTTEATPPAAKADDTTPPEGANAPAAESSERKEQRLPRWMKERLERERQVTRERTRAEMLEEFQRQQGHSAQTPHQGQQPQGEKTLEDFDFDVSKYARYLARQEIEAEQRTQQQRAEQEELAKRQETFKTKVDAFETRVGAGAWEDIESSRINTDPAFKPLVDLFLGDEHDLDIAHHLARNPAEADRLLTLSPMQRMRELSRLADQFSGESQPAKAASPPAPKTTNAPPPAKTVAGTGTPSVDVRAPNLSTADRIKQWRQAKG